MTALGKKLGIALAILALATSAACSKTDSPTSPTTPTVTAAVVQSISPASPTAATTTQIITVNGTGFVAGVSLILKSPDTGATLYGPSAISDLTSSSFRATVTMGTAGNWTATVRLPDGTTDSAQFAFTVAAVQGGTNPQITSVGPSTLVNGTGTQTINVTGVNFRAGLSLIVKDTLGVSTTYNGASITGQTSTSFAAQVLFLASGTYTLTVHNSDGFDSGAFPFVINARPVVTAVGPSTLTASSSTQVLDITGVAFGTGLTYVLNGPGTGAVLHGGADVTNLTATSFKAAAVLSVAGDWTITVISAAGVSSAQFAFHVGP